MRRILLVAFHFPPVGFSSGFHRTLKLAQLLPGFGWEPVVLAPHPRAYATVDSASMDWVPRGIEVHRTFALDTARHLAFNGRYAGWLALPDRWVWWWPSAVATGLRLIRRLRPALIWSTYPVASAHLIALTLHRMSGVPWVADLRDPMTMEGQPHDRQQRRVFCWLERRVLHRCRASTYTAPGTRTMYRERYPEIAAERFHVIPNGYDERDFERLGEARVATGRDEPLVLLHSGLISPQDRNPTAFFEALKDLHARGVLGPRQLRIVLRASGCDDFLDALARRLGVQDFIALRPWVPYREALEEMSTSDGLVLLQGSTCDLQIPAKAYEYLRVGRPILVLAHPESDTAALMREAGVDSIAPLDDRLAIATLLEDFCRRLRGGTCAVPRREVARRYSREAMGTSFARLFDQVLAERA